MPPKKGKGAPAAAAPAAAPAAPDPSKQQALGPREAQLFKSLVVSAARAVLCARALPRVCARSLPIAAWWLNAALRPLPCAEVL
jgi:hypothetical protein